MNSKLPIGSWLGALLILASYERILSTQTSSRTSAESPAPGLILPLEPIFRVRVADATERLVTRGQLPAPKADAGVARPAFLAIRTNAWPAGLVPLFVVERTNRFELRRLPPRGQENFSEPLFFALPPLDDEEAGKLAGRWDFLAIRGDGSKAFPALELACEAGMVSARFDQNTDYRFAQISEGVFRTNRLSLRIRYIADAYALTGRWREGRFTGEWRNLDDSERGTWEASREEFNFSASTNFVALYEWLRPADGARLYALEGELSQVGWERAPRPLCRVWKAGE